MRYEPKSSPSTVMMGIAALRSAWRTITVFSASPFARAVRTKSLPMASSIALRVIRARKAMERMPSAMAGRMR